MATQKVPVIPEITNDIPLASRRALMAMKVTIEYLLAQQGTTTSRFQPAAQVGSSGSGASNHEGLTGLLGGDYGDHHHLTGAQATDLTDGGDSTLHSHAFDRDLANAVGLLAWANIDTTGVSLSDIGTLAHAELEGVFGGTHHLNVTERGGLVNSNSTALHYHDADRDRASHTGTQALATINDVTITAANLNTLDDGADSALHFHATDRDSANFTGTDWTDLTDAGATTLHKHSHSILDDIGTNTHAQIDTHLASTANPHGVTAAQAGADPEGTAAAAVTAHKGAANPHPGYLTPAEGDSAYQPASATLDEYAAVNPTAAGLALLDDADASAQRTTLGLVIGTDVQAYDADLATWSSVTPGAGITTFLATPSSANLAAAVTDETGSGALVFGTSPTLTGPIIGSGDLTFATVGSGLKIKEGTNARMGVATLVAGAVTVANTSVTANTRIFLTIDGVGILANLGTPYEDTPSRVAGTSFTIKSSNILDTSTVSWLLIEPL